MPAWPPAPLTGGLIAAACAGAPHKVDEGAALWFGTGCEKGNIANVANKRGSSWGTMVNGTDGCTA